MDLAFICLSRMLGGMFFICIPMPLVASIMSSAMKIKELIFRTVRLGELVVDQLMGLALTKAITTIQSFDSMRLISLIRV